MKLFATLLFTFCLNFVFSQEGVAAAGAEATGRDGSASYSVGQVNYAALENIFFVSQGIQQAYTAYSAVEAINLRISVYPNPTFNILYIEVKTPGSPDLQYNLYNIKGGLLETKESIGNIAFFQMSRYATGVYLLLVTQNNRSVRSFKVIKN